MLNEFAFSYTRAARHDNAFNEPTYGCVVIQGMDILNALAQFNLTHGQSEVREITAIEKVRR